METRLFRYLDSGEWTPELTPDLDSKNTLVLFFSGLEPSKLTPAVEQIRRQFPQSHLMGCSTAGEILGSEFSEDSLVLAVVRFDHTRLGYATELLHPAGSHQAGVKLASSLLQPDLRAVFVLAEGLKVNGSQLIDGFNQVLPRDIVITGGLAGDGDRFDQTWVSCNSEPRDNSICAMGLYSERLHVAHGSRGGWDLLGPQRKVTRSHDNVLYELDGQPALVIYKKYLGERAEGLPSTGLLFPLALRDEHDDEEFKVRTILAVDEATQSITFAGDIPQGGFVRLMRANFDRLIDGAAHAAESLDLNSYKGEPLLSIAISCVGRHLVLGQRTEEEIEAVLESLPGDTRQIGYYSYGELSPLQNGRCDLHNQTMTLTLYWED